MAFADVWRHWTFLQIELILLFEVQGASCRAAVAFVHDDTIM